MKKRLFQLTWGLGTLLFCGSVFAKPAPVSAEFPLEGKWDLVVYADGKELPSWLEVKHSGTRTLVGQIVVVTGSARPIAKINFTDGKFSFTIPPQWEGGDKDFDFEGVLEGETISGTVNTSEGKLYKWKGVRSPLLQRTTAPVWGKPIKLLNGRDLAGWQAMGASNQWVIENGVLKSPRSGANLVTDQKFTDFKLHIEFRYQAGSNSGVYLRGRYEVQIQDDKGKEPSNVLFGGVYGFLTPSEMVAKAAGEWQSYDITLVGRMLNVVANGKQIICNQAIPGITGGALDSDEAAPGPILLQGDHGPIEYRNIVLTPAVK